MKKLSLKTCFIGTLFLGVFFAACTLEAPIEEDPHPGIPEGAGRVKVSLILEGRTALPTIDSLSSYVLTFTKSGEIEPMETKTITETALDLELEPGTYTLMVIGYDSKTTALVEGTEEFLVTANTEIPVSVSLGPTQRGRGTLKYTISLPPALDLDKGMVYLVSLSGGSDLSWDFSKETLSGSKTLTAGYYRAECELYGTIGGDFRSSGKTTIVHIYDNLETAVTFTFEADDSSNDRFVGSSEEFMAALTAIENSTVTDEVIYVKADFSLAPISLSGTGYNGKTIRIRSNGKREISLSENGALFTVGSGLTLRVEDIGLKGTSGNTSALVGVGGGTFILSTGSTISGNTASSSSAYGGGVYVYNSGTFEMSGGTISGNSAASSRGGGVFVSSGTFKLSGGTISGNTASAAAAAYGGGVYVASSGAFEMSGGTISGNTATTSTSTSTAASSSGGGVYVASSGTFEMSGGTISGNTASSSASYSSTSAAAAAAGGGVYVYNSGTFEMSGGTISGNTVSAAAYYSTSSSGGGVYVDSSGTFEMSDGTISGNTASSTTTAASSYYSSASSSGGGVYVANSGTFEMSGGTISGNTTPASGYSTSSSGGGVYVDSSGTFTKAPKAGGSTSGIIYGSEVTEMDTTGMVLKNTASSGSAVYGGSSSRRRNTTVGETTSLSTEDSTNWTD